MADRTYIGERLCSVNGCDGKPYARNLCRLHYTRWWRYGDPRKVVPRAESIRRAIAARTPDSALKSWRTRRAKGNANVPLRHGYYRTATYRIWRGMRERCLNPNAANYCRYGGRGITVCERWQGTDGFVNFLTDMGERPPNPPGWEFRRAYWSIERMENDGNYEPGNCRWASPSDQQRNRRSRLEWSKTK